MALRLTRRVFSGTLASSIGATLLAAPAIVRAVEPLKIRCSLDTAAGHLRNVSMVDYLKKVEQASNGRIVGEVFHAGALYADMNVAKALLQGQVEMCAPGTWTLTGLVPDCDFVQLPAFYGRSLETTHKATDGKAGQFVSRALEAKLQSHMLGPWLDLGFQNWYTTRKPIQSLADLKGLKIRSAGGVGIGWRIKLLGGIANVTPWPNVPLALTQGTFDGLVTTDQSIVSDKLWEAGIRHVYADHTFVAQYIPMIAGAFWSKLPPQDQAIMTQVWADNIGTYRAAMAGAQQDARGTMEKNGITFCDPSAETLAADRTRMMADQDTLIRGAKLSPEVVTLVAEALG
jgi:C4-dicarboxylate-binding protein DctP